VQLGERTEEGNVIAAPTATWFEISEQLKMDPNFRFEFCKKPTAFEEFLAGAYHLDGWDEVTLTPRSGDKGRDIIAVTTGMCAIRVLDQAKAYRASNPVGQNEVRAILGVFIMDRNASKGVITTTADFAPGVASEFEEYIPYRLETRNGEEFLEWLETIRCDNNDGGEQPGPTLPIIT
jgi:restriction system protein